MKNPRDLYFPHWYLVVFVCAMVLSLFSYSRQLCSKGSLCEEEWSANALHPATASWLDHCT